LSAQVPFTVIRGHADRDFWAEVEWLVLIEDSHIRKAARQLLSPITIAPFPGVKQTDEQGSQCLPSKFRLVLVQNMSHKSSGQSEGAFQTDLAIASYEKSLAMKPDNPSAKAELEKLKNPPKVKP
jgi:hypothetical protein